MKNIQLSITLFLLVNIAEAQQSFIGTVERGGDFSSGSIFRTDADGTNFETLFSFPIENRGSFPEDRPILFSDGLYYGTISNGGLFNSGVLYAYDLTSNEYEVKFDFSIYVGQFPRGTLVTDGSLLFGTTSAGAQRTGTLYQFDPTTETHTILHEFSQTGNQNISNLVLIDNTLYGTSSTAGVNNDGFLWSYDLTTEAFSILYELDRAMDGNNPRSLVAVNSDMLYGMMEGNGPGGAGNLFSYGLTSNIYQVLTLFPPGGSNGKLVLVGDDLFGTTVNGGADNRGTIYRFNTTTDVYTTEFSFNGLRPSSSLTYDGNGAFIGATEETIFEYEIANSTYTDLYTFDVNTFEYYTRDLLPLGNNEFLGMMPDFTSAGSLFVFDRSANAVEHKVLLNQAPLGEIPGRTLTLHSNDKYYGVTRNGGDFGFYGTLFEYDPGLNQVNVLHSFNGVDGSFPQAVTEGADGRLYGVTSSDATNNKGVIFSYDVV